MSGILRLVDRTLGYPTNWTYGNPWNWRPMSPFNLQEIDKLKKEKEALTSEVTDLRRQNTELRTTSAAPSSTQSIKKDVKTSSDDVSLIAFHDNAPNGSNSNDDEGRKVDLFSRAWEADSSFSHIITRDMLPFLVHSASFYVLFR